MKIHCATVPLIELSMAKVQRIDHEQRAQGTNTCMQLMPIKLNKIFFIFQYNNAETKILYNTTINQPSQGSTPAGDSK